MNNIHHNNPLIEKVSLRNDFSISRIIKGGYQLSAQYMQQYGEEDRDRIISDMFYFAEAGMTTFDCGDIYIGVEVIIG